MFCHLFNNEGIHFFYCELISKKLKKNHYGLRSQSLHSYHKLLKFLKSVDKQKNLRNIAAN